MVIVSPSAFFRSLLSDLAVPLHALAHGLGCGPRAVVKMTAQFVQEHLRVAVVALEEAVMELVKEISQARILSAGDGNGTGSAPDERAERNAQARLRSRAAVPTGAWRSRSRGQC